jgi:hypothetical protein
MGVVIVRDRMCFGDVHAVEGQRRDEGLVYNSPGSVEIRNLSIDNHVDGLGQIVIETTNVLRSL